MKRSNRRSIGISIERDGEIVVRAPVEAEFYDVEKFVADKQIWIHQKLAQKKALNRVKPRRDFVNGQGFLYLGKSYRLKIIDQYENRFGKKTNITALRLWQGYFELADSKKADARKHFIAWYKKQLIKQLKDRIPRYDKRVGVTVKDYRIADLGHRWASCGRNGTVSFNWRSVMAPIWVLEYILVHEMVHLIERRHSKQFWRLVSRVIPDYEEHVRWLNENGPDLDL